MEVCSFHTKFNPGRTGRIGSGVSYDNWQR